MIALSAGGGRGLAARATVEDDGESTERETKEAQRASALARALEDARREIAALKTEHDDLKLLYEATIAHGEAVEDQLAESNILLQKTQARLDEELNDAARYARSILPAPRAEWPRTDWFYEPSTELAGDSFGYHHLDADRFAIYLIDVCGHGVGAALLSAAAINVLRAEALPQTDFGDPGSVLAALNDAFPMEKNNDRFFTIWYGVHDRRTGELRYSSGGHPASILLRPGAGESTVASELGTQGNLAIGVFAGLDYANGSATVEAGDRLMVLSDGTYEIESTGGDMLELEDLVAFLSADAGRRPADVYRWVQAQNGEGPLPDDFSLVEIFF